MYIFSFLLSVPSKFKHKRVDHILNYQMFEMWTMIGNDECRFSSCLVSGIIFCWLSCIAENRLLTNLQVITYQTGILRWHITWLYACGLCTGNFCPMHFSFASLILPYLHTLTVHGQSKKLYVASLLNHLGRFDLGLIFYSKLITWLSGLRCKVSSQRQLVL